MPLFDGTGPRGKGPGSGRGLGRCMDGRGKAVSLLSGFSMAVLGLVVNDLRNPRGMIRGIVRFLEQRTGPRRISGK